MKDNELSLNELMELEYEALLRYCIRLTEGDEELAGECAAEAFLRAERLGDPPRHPNIRGWLKRTARNTVHEKLRQRREYYRRNVSLEGMLDFGIDLAAPFFGREDEFLKELWEDIDDDELERLKRELMSTLPAEDRELMELKYEKRLPLSEIAERVGKSNDAVRVKLSRLTDKVTLMVRNHFERN